MHTNIRTVVLVASLALLLSASGRAGVAKFYSDDPIWRDPETQDATSVNPIPISDGYDLVENSIVRAWNNQLEDRKEADLLNQTNEVAS